MDATAVNTLVTVVGIIVGIGCLAGSYFLGRKSERERIIQDVVNRFTEWYTRPNPPPAPGPLMLFIRAGAIALDDGELKKASKRILDACGVSPMDDEDINDRKILKAARDQGVNLDSLSERIVFLMDYSGCFEPVAERSQEE